ncbi:MAG: helix-turn-helix transcriptional regulator [Nitratireductor sp.]|nr:helix-turn-helix transcriptional regulator [Nitratireductor sp.]
MAEHQYLTTREVGELLRIKERKVYDLASSGALPCTRAIGKLLFPREEILAWLAENSSTAEMAKPLARPPVLLGSHDPLLEWAIRESRCGLATLLDSSGDGLTRFAAGEGIATGLHLPGNGSDDWNVDAVRDRFAARPVVLFEWARRVRGIAVHEAVGEPPAGLAALGGLRLVPRQSDAGTQIFFEHLLAAAGIGADRLTLTAPALSENDQIAAVATGRAEAAFALESLAASYKLRFTALAAERFDLLVDRKAWFEPPWQKLLAFTRSPAFAARAAELPGYDIAGLGTVHFNGA